MEGWAFLGSKVVGLERTQEVQNKSWCPQCLAAWGIG